MTRVRGYDTGGDEDGVALDAEDEASLRLEPEDVLEDDSAGDVGDLGYAPQDRPWAVDDPAVSGEEETLDQRLAEEEPETGSGGDGDVDGLGDGLGDVSGTDGELRDDEVGGARAGRLSLTDAGAEGGPDPEPDLEGFDEGRAGGAASAEEAAVHVVRPA